MLQHAHRRLYRKAIVAVSTALIVSLCLVIGGTLASASLLPRNSKANALSMLDALMPGQPVSALTLYSYACPPLDYGRPTGGAYCEIYLNGAPLHSVSVTVDGDSIQTLHFSMDGLQVIDLVSRWGRPDQIQKYAENYRLMWGSHVYAMVPLSSRVTDRAQVMSVIVFRQG